MSKTICAISTAPATAALGIIRISGEETFSILEGILKKKNGAPFTVAHGKAVLYRIEEEGAALDEAMVTCFEGPRSYTGEDTAELCCHGGLFVLQSVMELLVRRGCAPAGPGEFSKRAFLNGKLDLISAKAVIELIEATSKAQQKNALSRMEGKLSKKISSLYEKLVDLNTALLAYVDFPEEVDEPVEDYLPLLQEMEEQLSALAESTKTGRLIKEGLSIAIVGAPNVGKSTLMNQLLGYERSIVSSIPGTTRDMVREGCRLGDLTCHLSDTAGIRTTADPIEQQGISIARKEAEQAKVVFTVFDGSRPLNEDDRALMEEFGNEGNLAIINKADLPQMIDEEYISNYYKHIVKLSAQNGEGCARLDEWVRSHYSVEDAAAEGVLTDPNQLADLLSAKASVQAAVDGLSQGFTADLISIDIIEAASALGGITGQAVTDEMIDRIFSRFCVGK